ncbi:hypothetical protein [Planctomycetes bacterium K23_9]|uniref:Uncharacterized protein n=1 Tax=Stieleria marina TaxID=1930275 RepID=A0A517NZJ4_9BACT|nr:hypothetical protein K239x_45380 [Planctomycetes bacterium K23_9]
MKFAILGVLILIVIAFIYLLWKASKHWRWYHITTAVITMILAITLVFPTAMVLKSRAAWHQIKEKLEVQAENAQQENTLIKYGDPTDANTGVGLLELTQQLGKLGREAGRRWRGLQLQNANAQGVTLRAIPTTPPPGIPGNDDGAAAPEPASLPQANLVVYGFAEGNYQNQSVPVFYLGEFRVEASAGNQLTLSPTGPLEPAQLQAISGGRAARWSLYEMLPLDGHEPFVADGSESNDDNVFGRIDDALVNQLLGNKIRPETLQEYLRDGSRSNPDDVLLSRWVKVEFTKNHKIDVDSPTQQGALEGGFFDASGRAVDSRLQRGEGGDTLFRAEQQIIVKEEAAKQLIDVDGVAKLVDTYYLRPLNDYRFVLRRLRLRINEAASRKIELDFENKVLQDAKDATDSMLTVNQEIKLKLEQDQDQVSVELKAVSDYEAEVRAKVDELQKECQRLYQDNLRLEKLLPR